MVVEYQVNDWEKLHRYFIGKQPRTKTLFLKGLETNFMAAVGEHSNSYPTIIKHSSALQRLGVITKTIYHSISSDEKLEIKEAKNLRKEIRKRIKVVDKSVLKQVLKILHNSPSLDGEKT